MPAHSPDTIHGSTYLAGGAYAGAADSDTSGRRATSPYRPSSLLPQAELDFQMARGVYDHFHVPWNQHNRFLSAVPESDKYAYRDIPRMPPPPFDKSGRSSIRPQSAPRSRRIGSATATSKTGVTADVSGAPLIDNMVTLTGAPCYTVSALIEADLQDGTPLSGPVSPATTGHSPSSSSQLMGDDSWRVTRVQTYAVTPARTGYGEGGVRPFHQDYRHYKYYGFAGKGAKTSWAFNPKYNEVYASVIKSAADSTSSEAAANPDSEYYEPLQETIGGPRRPLTPAESHLVKQFRHHAYSAEGQPSQIYRKGGGSRSPRPAAFSGSPVRPGSAPAKAKSLPPAEIIEPYLEHVSIVTRQPLTPGEVHDHARTDRAKVATYRQPCPSSLTLSENPSPNHGSQSPFHQRYNHYKYHGFGGRGATSSWARNPKYALLYDH